MVKMSLLLGPLMGLKNNNDFKPVGELTSTAADGQTKHYEAEIIGDASGNTTFGILQQVPIKISLWITLRSQWNQKINLVYLSNLVYKLNVLSPSCFFYEKKQGLVPHFYTAE